MTSLIEDAYTYDSIPNELVDLDTDQITDYLMACEPLVVRSIGDRTLFTCSLGKANYYFLLESVGVTYVTRWEKKLIAPNTEMIEVSNWISSRASLSAEYELNHVIFGHLSSHVLPIRSKPASIVGMMLWARIINENVKSGRSAYMLRCRDGETTTLDPGTGRSAIQAMNSLLTELDDKVYCII